MNFTNVSIIFLVISQIISLKIDPDNATIKEYTIQSTRLNRTSKPKRDFSQNCINLSYANKTYKVHIRIDNESNMLRSTTPVYVYDENATSKSQFGDWNLQFVGGYVDSFENSSDVDGYLEDDTFYGRVRVNNETFYVEKLKNHPYIMSQLNDDVGSIVYRFFGEIPTPEESNYATQYATDFRKGYFCSMYVVIDYSFLKMVARGDQVLATTIVLQSINRTNTIFRSTDFDGDGVPDNIGFHIEQIAIMKSYSTPYIPRYVSHSIDTHSYIRYILADPALRTVCIGAFFTAQSFTKNAIGVSFMAATSFIGGICLSGGDYSQNAVAVSYMHEKKMLPQVVCDIALAHELGHSFGAAHDEGKECEGYLMRDRTDTVLNVYRFMFSPCSKRRINYIIGKRRSCLNSNPKPFCGNGILEADEECDCGSYYTCYYLDSCCYAHNSKFGCKIKRSSGYECHPSQGLCCTQSCQYRDITHLGLSCDTFTMKCSEQQHETCGTSGTCYQNECQSAECSRINLRECKCPPNNESQLCRTCCDAHGQCLSAIKATDLVINNTSDPDVISSLKKYQGMFKLDAYDVEKSYCKNNICAKIGFKMFPLGEYCLYKGTLGKCKSRNVCYVTEPLTWVPAVMPELDSKSTTVAWKSCEYLLTLILFLLCVTN